MRGGEPNSHRTTSPSTQPAPPSREYRAVTGGAQQCPLELLPAIQGRGWTALVVLAGARELFPASKRWASIPRAWPAALTGPGGNRSWTQPRVAQRTVGETLGAIS